MKTGVHRLWRLRMRHALWLALPVQLLVVWVCHAGWVRYERNRDCRSASQAAVPFDLDQWRYFTKKEVQRTLGHAFAVEVPDGGLQRIDLVIDRDDIVSLDANLPASGCEKWYAARLAIDGEMHRVKARYVGDDPWDWLHAQKSWDIKARSSDPIRDRRTFRLSNSPTHVFEEVAAHALLADAGLLVAEMVPVRLFVNGTYSGVHLWEDVADESMLRRFRRMPGSIYRTKEPDERSVFVSSPGWQKIAARNAEQADNWADIAALVGSIDQGPAAVFDVFAEEHVDIEAFAKSAAIGELLGVGADDAVQTIYFDPYKGRFEPVECGTGRWRMGALPSIEPGMHRGELFAMLRGVPEFQQAARRQLDLLMQRWPPKRFANLIDENVRRIAPALAADGRRAVCDGVAKDMLRLANAPARFFSMAEFELQAERCKSFYSMRYGLLRKGPAMQSSLYSAPMGTSAPMGEVAVDPAPDPTPDPELLEVVIGPGEVTITESRFYGAATHVVVQPGTTLRMLPDVSIEFCGKVTAVGTTQQPIRILAAAPGKPWGTFALHGRGTAGSRFAHCEWQDGSTAELRMVLRTGMVSIIDSADIRLFRCLIGRNHVGDDALHFGYVEGGEVRECEFARARSDAFDVDISNDVTIVGCVFHHSGNDALDLMTSKVTVRDCRFHDTGDKGISVGEATTVTVSRSRFSRCYTGLEIKDASVATVDGSTRFVDCPTGVNLYRKNTRYTNGGTLIADELWVAGSPEPLVADRRSTVRVGRMHTAPRGR